MSAHHPFLQPSPYGRDAGALIGRDPREITEAEWAEHMPGAEVSYKRLIRAMCLSCCNGSYAEVTKCTVVSCPLWAVRTGKVPAALRAAVKGSTADEPDDDTPATDLDA